MYAKEIQQNIYKTMQETQILLRCLLSCVMNMEQQEMLQILIYRSSRYIQQFHSAVSATGRYLDEISVWKTVQLHCKGYAYRYFSNTAIQMILLDLLSRTENTIAQFCGQCKTGSRSYLAVQRYLDLIKQTKHFVQAS